MARWRRFGQTDMDMIFMTIEKKNPPSLNTLFPLLSYGGLAATSFDGAQPYRNANDKNIITEF